MMIDNGVMIGIAIELLKIYIEARQKDVSVLLMHLRLVCFTFRLQEV